MSERIDRRIRGSRLLPVALTAILAVAAAAGIYVWSSIGASPSSEDGTPVPLSPAQAGSPEEPLTITLYAPVDGMLVDGASAVSRQPDTQSQAQEALDAVLSDQRALRSSPLSQVKIREFFLDASGTAYVDLSPITQNGVKASGWEELLALYAVVNTLMLNFEEIRQVRFLIDGKEAQTFAGHIDLSRKFDKRMDLVKQ